MKNDIVHYYLLHRPLFLAIIRGLELPLYCRYARFRGKMLDYGCGDGFFLHTLKKCETGIFGQSHLTGLDIDPKAVQKADLCGLYQSIIQYDGNKTSFKNGSFDTVISNCVLEHLPNLNHGLKEIYRLLKPGGRFYLTVMTDKWNDYLFLPAKWWQKKQKHYNLFSIKHWKESFLKEGFVVEKSVPYLNQSQSKLVEWLHFASIFYLLAEKWAGGWEKAGFWYAKIIPITKLKAILDQKATRQTGAAAFFVLRK